MYLVGQLVEKGFKVQLKHNEKEVRTPLYVQVEQKLEVLSLSHTSIATAVAPLFPWPSRPRGKTTAL